MKIVICAVPYSPNLGDGVIFENIKQLLLERLPTARISALDIAGRDNYPAAAISPKSWFDKIPKLLRPYAVCAYCGLQYILRWRRKWIEQLRDADLIVVGGGQLLLDVDLNFPIKLFLLSIVIKAIGKSGKVAIFGVGASKNISGIGTRLVRRTFANLSPMRISTRDIASARNLKALLAMDLNVRVAADPAIYSKQTFSLFLSQRTPGNVLGICVSSPLELNQVESGKSNYGQQIGEYFLQLARKSAELGYQVHLFTNGSPRDEAFKDALAANLESKNVVNLPRPCEPAQLVANIGNCDCIVAHRLHANIVAYALDIPSIGLNWDCKIKSFFDLTGREGFFINAAVPGIEQTFNLLYQARKIDGTSEKARLMQQLTSEIAALLNVSGLHEAVVVQGRHARAATVAAS